MPRRPIASLVVALALAAVALRCDAIRPAARIGAMEEQEFTVDPDAAVDASVRLSYWAGKLRVKPGDPARAARLRTRDNVEGMEPHADSRREGDHLDLRFWLDSEESLINLKSWSDGEESTGDPENDVVNEWDFELSRSLPLALDLDLALCAADVELGGIPLRSARLDLGGGSAVLSFARPNPERLDRLTLAIGAGGLVTKSLGNSHARSISVDAGAGTCVLDLAGDWRADALIEVDAGACGVEIRVPRDLAVKANLRETILASLTAPEFSDLGDRCYASPAWGKGGPSLVIEVSASLGGIRLVLE